jgi:opacity protein-like surface antigen
MRWGRASFCVGLLCAAAALPANAADQRTWYGSIALNASETDFSGSITGVPLCGLLGLDPCPVVGEQVTRTSDLGYGVTAALGKKLGDFFRIEGEVGYRKSDATQSAELSQMTAMLNGLFDLHVTDSLTLSVGGGVGIDFASWDQGGAETDDSSLAYQGIAGVSFALTKNIDPTLDHRYMSVSDIELNVPLQYNPSYAVSVAVDELDTQSVSLGLRFAL